MAGGTRASWCSPAPRAWLGTLTRLNDGAGYWVEVSAPGTITIKPDPYFSEMLLRLSYFLRAGDSYIGFTSDSGSNLVDNYLATLGDKWEKLYRYNTGGGFEIAAPGSAGFLWMEAGRGYSIKLKAVGALWPVRESAPTPIFDS